MTLAPVAIAFLCAAPSLRLTSSVDAARATTEWKYVRANQRVTLHAELGAAPKGPVQYRWFKLEPTVESVDNTEPSFHFEKIRYAATPIDACDDLADCPADVNPTVLAKTSDGLGTMAFQVVATLPDGRELKTPGLEAMRWGGLTREVHRVAVRRDDSYLGYLTELFNTPYIFGSAGPDGRNQTDLLIGSDCADLAVYGQRRLGKKASYTSTFTIDQQAPEVARGVTQDERGVYLDEKGKPVAARAGDVLHFPNSRHVAVLWEDKEPLGVLDAKDVMVHTCWAPPALEAIADNTRCASLPIRVLRFR